MGTDLRSHSVNQESLRLQMSLKTRALSIQPGSRFDWRSVNFFLAHSYGQKPFMPVECMAHRSTVVTIKGDSGYGLQNRGRTLLAESMQTLESSVIVFTNNRLYIGILSNQPRSTVLTMKGNHCFVLPIFYSRPHLLPPL